MSSSFGDNNRFSTRNWSPGSTSRGNAVNNNRLFRAPRPFPYGPAFPTGTILPRRILVIPGEMPQTVNPSLRRFIQDFTPVTGTNQWPMQLPPQEDGSILTQDEQYKALGKLKKTIYNPPLKTRNKWCLYYRDNAINIMNRKEEVNDEDVKGCVICLEDFVQNLEVLVTPCNHMFHEDCIVPWVKSHGRCPICRSALHKPGRENEQQQ